MRNFTKIATVVILTLAFSFTTVFAGSLTPPGSTADTMYTLTNLYNLFAGTSATVGSGAIPSTPGSASPTFHTLTEVYNAIFGEIDNLSNNTIASGTSAFGFTGGLSLACITEIFNGTANLVGAGVDGSGDGSNRWCMKETGDAVAGEIVSGKKAWVDGLEVTGSMTARTGDTAVVTSATSTNTLLLTAPAGYYNGSATISTTSPTFTAANIKSGTYLFGIIGTASSLTYGDNDASKVLTTASFPGTAVPAALLKTKQAICYATDGSTVSCSGTGQDGELQKGIARSYTDNGDGTITDNSTGLVWQKQDDAVTRTWANALTFCNTNAAGLSGSGWRMPNAYELYSILDFSVSANPSIDGTYFPSTTSGNYWTSTSRPIITASAITVNFLGGGAGLLPKSLSTTVFIRCVRG